MRRILVEHPSGSAVLAFDPARKVAFTVRQSRLAVMHARHPPLAEPVAGVIDGEEGPAESARREVEEELGILLRHMEAVGQVWVTPSSSTERVFLFLAEYHPADRISAGGGAADEMEELLIREEPLRDLWNAATGPGVMDAKLFMLLQALRLRRPDLFSSGEDAASTWRIA